MKCGNGTKSNLSSKPTFRAFFGHFHKKKYKILEDDVFKITIPLNKEAAKEASDQKKLSDREQAIYNLICEYKHLTVEQVMAEFDISRATVFRDYAKIKKISGAVYDKNESVWKL